MNLDIFASLAAWRLILPDAACQRYTNFGTRLHSLLDRSGEPTSLISLSTRLDGTRPQISMFGFCRSDFGRLG
jgi:hypothetical protein